MSFSATFEMLVCLNVVQLNGRSDEVFLGDRFSRRLILRIYFRQKFRLENVASFVQGGLAFGRRRGGVRAGISLRHSSVSEIFFNEISFKFLDILKNLKNSTYQLLIVDWIALCKHDFTIQNETNFIKIEEVIMN